MYLSEKLLGHPIYVYILYIFTKFHIFCSLINTFNPQKCSLVINMLKSAILELLVILVPKTDLYFKDFLGDAM